MSEKQQPLVVTSKYNGSNICRVTLPTGQYYTHMGTTIAGNIILGFNEVNEAINVLGMDEGKYKEAWESNDPDKWDIHAFIDKSIKIVSQIPLSHNPMIDWYD